MMKIFKKIKSVPNKMKDIKQDFNDDIKVNRDTYRYMSYDWTAKLMNFIFRENKTTKEWLDDINERRRKKGKKQYL